jgi:hypothetical protein
MDRLGRSTFVDRPQAENQGVRDMALWRLTGALAAAIGLVALMDAAPGIAGLVVFVLGMAILGIAGAVWGRDSREAGDWSPDSRARALRG